MAKLVIVRDDSVQGTDKHKVTGTGPNPSPPPPTPVAYAGTGDFDYVGRMTTGLSDFVTIGGKPVATVTSKSSLNPGESSPSGHHSGPAGSNFVADPSSVAQQPTTSTLVIADTIGTGVPSTSAGSTLLTIGGTRVLLDGDKVDTCDGTGRTANSTISAEGQDFVTCSI